MTHCVYSVGKALRVFRLQLNLFNLKAGASGPTVQDTESFYRAVIEGVTDVIYTLSPDGIILSVNPAFERILGMRAEDWIGKPFMPLIYPADLPSTLEKLSEVLSGQPVSRFEVRTWSSVGELYTFEVSCTPKYREGKVEFVLGVARDITQRTRLESERNRRVEEQVARMEAQASEKRYRELAEALPVILWTATPEGKIDYANNRWEEFTGQSISDGLGEGWLSTVYPEDRGRVIRAWMRTINENVPYQIEYRIRSKDGVYRWQLVRAEALKDSSGKIRKWLGICSDIHEQITSREKLSRSEERFRLVAKSTNDQIWDWDLVTDKVERNAGLHCRYGYSNDLQNGKVNWWRENLHPDDRLRVLDSIEKALNSGDSQWEAEYRFRCVDGRYAYVYDRGHIVRDSFGTAVRMVGAMMDFTAARSAEGELRRIKFISDNANDVHLIFGSEGTFIYVNKVACERLGYSEAEFSQLALQDIDPAFDPTKPFDERFRLLEESPITRFESQFLRKDGSQFPVEITVMAVQCEGERYIFVGARDISERRKNENVLRSKTEGLARSNAELEQFAYIASHDLKEPLRMVNSYLQLLERRSREALDHESCEFLEFAMDGAERMYVLIDDLLAYSRVGANEGNFDLVNLDTSLEIATANLDTLIQETGASILKGNLPMIVGEGSQIVQLFQNLIGNALKFKSHLPPQVKVSAQERKQDWLFSVSDNGIGIDSIYFEKIFVIFQRLHTRQSYPGTGIGLAICKKIVDHHGGRIWVESDGRTGTTFHFTFPKRELPPKIDE